MLNFHSFDDIVKSHIRAFFQKREPAHFNGSNQKAVAYIDQMKTIAITFNEGIDTFEKAIAAFPDKIWKFQGDLAAPYGQRKP